MMRSQTYDFVHRRPDNNELHSRTSRLMNSADRVASHFRRTAHRRPYAAKIWLACAIVLGLFSGPRIVRAADDTNTAATPLPPQRPATLGAPASAPQTGDINAPAAGKTPASGDTEPTPPPKAADEPIRVGAYNDGPGSMLRLPPASHARMHQCAAEWQNMKTTGAAEEKTWFNFALKCLTR
jgi:hypothetical protein